MRSIELVITEKKISIANVGEVSEDKRNLRSEQERDRPQEQTKRIRLIKRNRQSSLARYSTLKTPSDAAQCW